MADVALVRSKIKIYYNHPIPGQGFADIFPIFRDLEATEAVISHLANHIKVTHDPSTLSSIVCLESRGFFFAPLLAARLSLPCVPVRKKGKLPGDVVTATYMKEYGPDVFEMKTDAFSGLDAQKKVILIDDLLATGGSVAAAKSLVEQLGMEVAEVVCIFDVVDFYGLVREKLGEVPFYAMVHLTGKDSREGGGA